MLAGCAKPSVPTPAPAIPPTTTDAGAPPMSDAAAADATQPVAMRTAAAGPPTCPERQQPYASGRSGKRPRIIVLVTADDLGFRCLGFEGNTFVKTPAFDRLAAEGAHIPLAFGATSSCSASRTTFITGQYPSKHGVVELVHRDPRVSLRKNSPTVPRALQKLGFRTAVMGKFHISLKDPKVYGYDANLNPQDDLKWRFRDVGPALKFVERSKGKPVYLEINFMDTHLRGNGKFPVEPDFKVDPDRVEVPKAWALPQWPELREMTASYFSQVMQTDRLLGNLLDGLDKLGVADEALVIFVSDNGAPFPGSKTTLYDRGIGTPMIFRWPGRIDRGQVVAGMASTVDLAPTMLDAAGAEPPRWVQGVSLLDRLSGRGSAPDAIFAEMHSHAGPVPTRAVRTEQHKYIINFFEEPIPLGQLNRFKWAKKLAELPNQSWAGRRPKSELYDLQADPNELENLSGRDDLAEIEADLRHRLRCHMQSCDDPMARRV
jgi:N-sulfoglucosamine sulfohydrolase